MSLPIADWLRSIGLERYLEAFREHEVDSDLLASLTSEDLRELGVVSVGHRRRMLNAISEINGGGPERTGRARPKAGAGSVRLSQAERRHMTILFCDLTGSTALSEQLDPEDLRTILTGYSGTVKTVVEQFNGFVAQYIGDGVLAYFGWPQAHEDDAERAVRAGMRITEKISKLETAHGEAVNCRVGIASGPVVIGDLVGDHAVDDNHVVGRTPNLAARLQALAEPGTVVVSSETRELVGERLEFASLGMRQMKGISGVVEAWRADRVVEGKLRFSSHRHANTPMFGRSDAYEQIRRALSDTREGASRTLVVKGDAGIGKSRLMDAARQFAEAEGFQSLHFQCSPYHTNDGLYPVIEQFRSGAGIDLADAPEVNLPKLAGCVRRCGVAPEPAVAFLAPLVLVIDEVGADLRHLDSMGRKEKAFEALFDCLEGLVARGPTLVLFEDLHWIDPTTLEMIGRAIKRIHNRPVMLMASTRDEGPVEQIEVLADQVLRLDRLSQEDAASLVASVPGAGDLSEEMVALILERTDGVPLFVEELTRTVIETTAGDDRTTIDPDKVSIPTTLQGSLIARLDLLPAEKLVAQTASAIGRRFNRSVLASTLRRDQFALQPSLQKLADAGILIQRKEAPDTFDFKHQLLRDAVYSSLLRGDLPRIHRRIAEAMEDRDVRSVGTSHLLATHWAIANEHARAAHYFAEAGRTARNRYANAEATTYLRSALKHMEFARVEKGSVDTPLPDRIGVMVELSEVLALSNRVGDASDVLEMAIRDQGLDTVGRARLLCRLGQVRQQDRDFSLATLDRAEAVLGTAGAEPEEAVLREWIDIQVVRLTVHYWSGDTEDMQRLAERITPYIHQANPGQRAEIFAQLVQRDLRALRYMPSAETIRNAHNYVEAAKQTKDLATIASARFILGFTYLHDRTLEEAERWIIDGLAAARRSGNRAIELRCLVYLATVHRLKGDAKNAVVFARESLHLAEREDMSEYVGMAMAHLAWAAWRGKDMTEARKLGSAALGEFGESRIAYPFEWAAILPMVSIALADGDVASSLDLCRRLVDPSQQRMPDELEATVSAALKATHGETDHAVRDVISTASRFGYL